MCPLLRVRLSAMSAMVVLCAAACGGEGADRGTTDRRAPVTSDVVRAADFDPALFDGGSTTIDHKWFPLEPGTQLRYHGASIDDGERLSHRVVFTVTDLTIQIAGVDTLVGWERDYTEGELVEAEIVFFAQDKEGNVWHLGQYPEEYEGGRVVAAPAWIAGVEGARAGIMMKAHPKLGAPDYSQGFAPPPIQWIDRARVYKMHHRTCVPAGCYDDVLVTEEFERNKPNAFQLKFYAPGVGNVRVGWRGSGEKERETLVLTDVVQLSPAELAAARDAARALERRAHETRKRVFGDTPLAEQLAGDG